MNRKLRGHTSLKRTKHCHRYAKGGYTEGGEPSADTNLRRGGPRCRATGGKTTNPHDGHPGYGFLSFLNDIPLIGGVTKMLGFSHGGDLSGKGLHRAMGGAGKVRKNYPYT